MPLESRVDVLIIGAGPAGLVCANALTTAGAGVRIIDKRPTKLVAGQADGIMPRTIEVLQSYGPAERLIREGNQIHMCTFYDPGRDGGIECTRRAPSVIGPTARYPFLVTLHQEAIKDIFLDSMRDHGVKVERPSRPIDIEISENTDELSSASSYPVKVTVERLTQPTRRARQKSYMPNSLLGQMEQFVDAKCSGDQDHSTSSSLTDILSTGAHSWVRSALGIEMQGEQTDCVWGVIDIVPETNFPDVRNTALINSRSGSSLVIPREGNLVRFYIQLSDADVIYPLTGRVDKSKMTPQKLVLVLRKILHPFELDDPKKVEWWTIYTIGQRIASSYSVKDRVFVAGDACHTHSPKAGQGMDASMNDTHNLAWKLAQVLRGWSNPSLLKTYEHERRKYAQDLINFDKEFATLFSGKPRTPENEDGVFHEQLMQAFQTFGGFASGIGVHYTPSAIVDPKHQECAEGLIIGQRMLPQIFVRAADICPVDIQDMLPADVRFKVLFFVGNLTETRIVELKRLAGELSKPSSTFHKYSPDGNISTVFDIITITAGTKNDINYLIVPSFFRPHWTKVFLDDTDMTGSKGGGAYARFGIDPKQITLVVVRPDGYVGAMAPSSAIADLDNYFGSFLIPHALDS